ncbi:MAG: BatA domain-containing protein [Phycisphaeraceae bacterium]|nr:BatA domain-containing protein [Phycisphaeraceae bacterium]
MTFLNPTLAMAALACIAAPIIIHLLFRRKRKPLEWGAMKFVLEAFRRHKRRLRLEQILLLAARTLAVLCLALAVGRPLFSGASAADSRRPRDLTIVIDNSLASQARAPEAGSATELDSQKQRAAHLLEELDAGRGDRATIVTLASPAEKLLAEPSGDLTGVRRVLDLIEPADSGADFSGAAALARDNSSGDSSREKTVALLSPLRAGSIDLSRETPERDVANETVGADTRLTLVASPPSDDSVENVAITGLEPLRSMLLRTGQITSTQQARVSLRRFGRGIDRPASVQLRLRVTDGRDGDDEQSWTKTPVRFAAGEDAVTVLAPVAMPATKDEAIPTASWIEGRIDDDAITSDNVFRRPWKVREQLRIALIAPVEARDGTTGPAGYSAADWLTLALAPTASTQGVDLGSENDPIRISRIDPGRLTGQALGAIDAAFVVRPDLVDGASWPLIADFARKGGLVVVCPAPQTGVQRWTDEFVKAMGFGWIFEREVIEFKDPRPLGGANADQAIIGALGADLTELTRPVVATRLLGVDLKGDGSWLLRLNDHRPLLASARPIATGAAGKGLIVVFFVSPELSWTNLPAMPLMVPLIQEIVRQGVGIASGSIDLVAGAALESPDELRAIESKDGAIVPTIAKRSGIWRRVDDRGVTKDVIAVNVDTRGSSTTTQPRAALESFLRKWMRTRDFAWAATNSQSPGAPIMLSGSRRTPPIDLPLLLAGLLLLMVDVVFSRLFSHATVRADRLDRPALPQSAQDQPSTDQIREVAA